MLSIYLVSNGPWDQDLYLNIKIEDYTYDFFFSGGGNEWIVSIIQMPKTEARE